jgi:hypothetical protein
MQMLANIRKKILWSKPMIRFFYAAGIYSRYLKKKYARLKIEEYWDKRIKEVLRSPDNKYISKVENAGKIIGNHQVMHNGVKVLFGSYYGMEVVRMLELNGGVHEPQEERVFAELVRKMPENAVMLELGSYWSFYSLWFQKEVKGARNFMIEPDYFCYLSGKYNFKLNRMKGVFTQAFVSSKSSSNGGVKTICIDDYANEHGIGYINLLHCDIQGYEYEMLIGAKKLLDAGRIGCFFISTHSNDLHKKCTEELIKYGFRIIASADINQSYSWDGVLIAVAPSMKSIEPVPIFLRD